MASRMASTRDLSRPSEKLGTHSTSAGIRSLFALRSSLFARIARNAVRPSYSPSAFAPDQERPDLLTTGWMGIRAKSEERIAKSGLLMPRISHHELHRAVDARILVPQRSVRQVIDLGREIDGITSTMEPLQAQLGAAGEVDLRRVAGRQVLRAEHHPANGSNIGRHRLSCGEIPLEDDGIDRPRILPVTVNPELVQRDDIQRHLEAAAQGVVAQFMAQHPPNAPSDEKSLRAGSGGKGLAAAGEQAPVPSWTAKRVHWTVGRHLRQQRRTREKAKESKTNGDLHGLVRVNAKLIRLRASEQIWRLG